MKHLIVYRTSKRDLNQTLGVFNVVDDNGITLFNSKCLERGWANNRRRVSCIPTGTYDIVLEYSARFDKQLWEIKDVPNRSECKIHASNYWNQLNGCIALGVGLSDINNDGYLDVTSSRNAMNSFHSVMGKDTKAKITIIDL